MKAYKKPISLSHFSRQERGFFSSVAESVSAFASGFSEGVSSIASSAKGGSDIYAKITDGAVLSVKKAIV